MKRADVGGFFSDSKSNYFTNPSPHAAVRAEIASAAMAISGIRYCF
jgi:hypothetical protein